MFNVGLTIHNRSGNPLPGTPLRLNFKKECAHRGVYDSLDASNPTLITSMQGSVYIYVLSICVNKKTTTKQILNSKFLKSNFRLNKNKQRIYFLKENCDKV